MSFSKDVGNLRRVDAPTILVVDDEPALLDLIAMYLERAGYHVLKARDPMEAFALAEQHPIRLLLVDVALPLLNGPQLAVQIQAICRDVRVVYMSGYSEDILNNEPCDTTRPLLLCKPFSEDVLLNIVKLVLHKKPQGSIRNDRSFRRA